MEYRTGDDPAVSPHSELRELSSSAAVIQQIPRFFIVLLELRTFVPDNVVAIRLFF